MILVGIDGSAQALEAMREALHLAACTGDDLLVVTVWHERHATLGIPMGVEVERDAAVEAAARGAAVAQAIGLEPEVVIGHGQPGQQICAVAREREARMIVVGSRGRGRVGEALLGSVSAHVIRHAPCPVLVVRATPSGSTRVERTSTSTFHPARWAELSKGQT